MQSARLAKTEIHSAGSKGLIFEGKIAQLESAEINSSLTLDICTCVRLKNGQRRKFSTCSLKPL